ncbi:hypothetical protein [Ralstonia pseudosolanacearum]|uniref:hypothetical protein n=1 Tax=Ralstonia pseudosolanacearum TaxID=1310165 RepID=UPI001FFD4290|nr:hypothetical protein [Ralstonia pseudosolanacearum]
MEADDMGALDKVLPALAKLAPMIATGLGGPLAGGAVAALESVFGIAASPDETLQDRQQTLATAIAGASAEQLLALRKADQDYQARMAEAGFKNQEALASVGLQTEQAYLSDTQDARHANAQDGRVFWLGIVVLTVFAIVMFAALWGSYALLTGEVAIKDPTTASMVAGFVGTIIGYVAANAQQVVGFFFGSSRGSDNKSQSMASAFSAMLSKTEAPK